MMKHLTSNNFSGKKHKELPTASYTSTKCHKRNHAARTCWFQTNGSSSTSSAKKKSKKEKQTMLRSKTLLRKRWWLFLNISLHLHLFFLLHLLISNCMLTLVYQAQWLRMSALPNSQTASLIRQKSQRRLDLFIHNQRICLLDPGSHIFQV